MYWLISLNGNSIILSNLERMNSHHCSLCDESDDPESENYLMRSSHFNGNQNAEEVISAAKGMLQLINGSSAISWGFSNFNNRGLITIDRIFYSEISNPRDSDLSLVNLSGDIPPSNPFIGTPKRMHPTANPYQHDTTGLIQLCDDKEDVFNLLRQSSAGFDWRNLFCIWDTIFYYCGAKGEKAVISELGLDKSEVEAFRGTANSFEVLGLESRHGLKSWTRPTKTMTLSEAMGFMSNVVNKYLQKRHCLNCYRKKWNTLV